MQPVTICTKQSQVAFVGFPILKAVRPVACFLSFKQLFFSVNMVYVKNAMVTDAATNALAAKLVNKSKFLFPVFRVLVGRKAVFVPIVGAARISAKSVGAFFAAIFAWLLAAPSMRQIAGLTAKLASAIFESIRMNLKLFGAVFAALCYLCFFSHLHILNTLGNYKPKYFDIACQRIEQAVAQGQLFEPEQPKQVQEQMFVSPK
jgi:hypothetical protein